MPQTSPLAIVSLITGILGLLSTCLCFIGGLIGLAGLICGIVARKQISDAAGRLTGGGFALGGIITGAISLVLTVVSLIFFLTGGFTHLFNDY